MYSLNKRDELMSERLVDEMYNNMWQYMNEDVIKYIFKLVGCPIRISKKRSVDDDNFCIKKHGNTICFKGGRCDGHYVYVNEELKVTGTAESNLIYVKDSGICHGAALTAALHNCFPNTHPYDKFTLIHNPKNRNERLHNYTSIFNTYKYLITSGVWLKVIENYWTNIDHKTLTTNTNKSLKIINAFLSEIK